MKEETNTVLLVDNSSSDKSLSKFLEKSQYYYDCYQEGNQAFRHLLDNSNKYAAIVLGHDIIGISVKKLMIKITSCSNLITIPILIQTDNDSMTALKDFLRSGARFCFNNDQDEFNHLLEIAIKLRKCYYKSEMSLTVDGIHAAMALNDANFYFRRLDEALAIANFIAESCPNPRLAVIGISELCINAVEHGNLNITYDEKTSLQREGNWMLEVERRTNLPENKNKFAHLNFKRDSDNITIRITDQGNGFDWKKFEEIDDKRVFDNHGRGIAMAKSLSFETLEYFGCGNEVECKIKV